MESYTTIEKLIEFGKIWLGTEVGIAAYIMGIPLFFYILVGDLKNGLKECDFDVFLDLTKVVTIFYIIVAVFFW